MTTTSELCDKIVATTYDTLTPEAEAAMQAWLDDNPQGKFGKHEYQLDKYGLSVEALAPRFHGDLRGRVGAGLER